MIVKEWINNNSDHTAQCAALIAPYGRDGGCRFADFLGVDEKDAKAGLERIPENVDARISRLVAQAFKFRPFAILSVFPCRVLNQSLRFFAFQCRSRLEISAGLK